LYKLEEQVQSFKQARDLAGEAVRIFRTEVPERPRLIESLIELGCVYREWVRTDYRPSDLDPARRTLVQNGKEAFRDAIREGEAEEEFLYLVVEAQVNLAWLHYYVGEIKQALEELESVMRRVPREYHITSEDGLPSKDLPLTFYWAQMGEACLLRGQMFMDEFRESQKLDALENAVRWYTLSLAYNELYASLSRDIRHGLERIYDNLKELNVREEFPAVRRAVDEAAREYHLPKRTRMHEFLDDSFSWMKAV
jgi:tetratricopeptide (TPR) repeat protein